MKKISSGLQFHVYDNGERVLKKPSSKFHTGKTLIRWKLKKRLTPFKLIKEINKYIDIRNNSLKILEEEIDFSILGNPVSKGNFIEQDKVVPLFRLNIDERVIDKYIENIFKTWSYGFADTIFNFTINNGINKKGEVILLDFGELTFDKNKVKKYIKKKKWKNSWSFKRLDEKTKEIYLEKMNKKITEKNLEKYWKKAIKK